MRITVEQAAAQLRSGAVVGVPTETVYGLAASLDHPAAIQRIFTLKNRPADNPLIIHLSSIDQIKHYVEALPEGFHALAQACWPGPLTLVIPVIVERIPTAVRAGLTTAAFRVPGHQITRQLLELTGPLVMPSANVSGKPSSTTAEHVEADFGEALPVLDGGACIAGVESTILIFEEDRWALGRLGAIPAEQFMPILGYLPSVSAVGTKPLCPGQRYRHYAPLARLYVGERRVGDAVVGYAGREYPGAGKVFLLGADPSAAAEALYGLLRRLDEEGVTTAWVDLDVPQKGLWLTLLDRLHKAADKNNDN